MRLLRLRVRSADDWRQSLATGTVAGAVFVPTTERMIDGEEVLVEVTGPTLPNKVVFRGAVQSWRQALPRLRVRAGATVQFAVGQEHKTSFIDTALDGGATDVPRRRHDRYPVNLAVEFRIGASGSKLAGTLIEVSAGGGLLLSATMPAVGLDLLVDITPVGAVAPMTLAAKVSYHTTIAVTAQLAAGMRFVNRDSDGARRLRELVRRLVAE
jgi:Tfp pilus assembly protein PilZ